MKSLQAHPSSWASARPLINASTTVRGEARPQQQEEARQNGKQPASLRKKANQHRSHVSRRSRERPPEPEVGAGWMLPPSACWWEKETEDGRKSRSGPFKKAVRSLLPWQRRVVHAPCLTTRENLYFLLRKVPLKFWNVIATITNYNNVNSPCWHKIWIIFFFKKSVPFSFFLKVLNFRKVVFMDKTCRILHWLGLLPQKPLSKPASTSPNCRKMMLLLTVGMG